MYVQKINWDESLAVDVEIIDEQHKMLFQRMNDLSDAIDRHRGVDKIMETLDFLIDYTDFHFSAEEKIMEENDYPGMKEHKDQHALFKSVLDNLCEDFKEEGATTALADSLDTLLVNWLVNHIKTIDVAFGKFLNEIGFVSPKDA